MAKICLSAGASSKNHDKAIYQAWLILTVDKTYFEVSLK